MIISIVHVYCAECGKRGVIEFLSSSMSNKDESLQEASTSLHLTASALPSSSSFSTAAEGRASTSTRSWPWMVLLGKKDNALNDTFFCSGVLINENYILSSAHCILNADAFFVRLREHGYNSQEISGDRFETMRDVEVEEVVFHPKFKPSVKYFDVALLRLAQPIIAGVSPICLPWGDQAQEDLENQSLTLISWERNNIGGQTVSIINEETVTVLGATVCSESYYVIDEFKNSFPEDLNNDNILCAGHEDETKGFPGGAVMNYDERGETFTLVGVMTNDRGCGLKDFPSIYTSIRNVLTLEWIKDVVFIR